MPAEPDKPVQESALSSAIRNNDVTIVTDKNHTDESISAAIRQTLRELGPDHTLSVIMIEADSKQRSMEQIRSDGEFGRMVVEAEKLGIRVELIDDRSRQMERDSRYPEEAELKRKTDPYMAAPAQLIAKSSNPQKMGAYLDEINANADADLKFRNERMIKNIDRVIQANPAGKKLAFIGAAHLDQNDDIDEGLREKGHQVTTVEINSKQSGPNMETRGPDSPDIIIGAENPDTPLSFKDPKTGKMQGIMEGVNIPWRNTEPVANVPRSELSRLPPATSATSSPPAKEINR